MSQSIKLFEDLKGELRNWNVDSVAKEAEVAPSTIYFWLDGRTKKPRLDTIVKVSKAIGFELRLVKIHNKLRLVA